MREEVPDVLVEPNENVLNFAAARAEGVADVVHCGIAHPEKIGATSFAKMQSIDGFLRKLGQSRVSIRAGGPLTVEGGVRTARARLTAQTVRKSEVPAVWRNRAESFFSVPVGFFRERKSPGLAVIRFRRMGLGFLLDKRLYAVRARGDPIATFEPGGGVGLMAGHGERGAGLQRKGDDSSRAAGLKLQFLSKRWHCHPPARIAALRIRAGVANVLHVRVRGASH